jgi:cytochrome c biogenesis protein
MKIEINKFVRQFLNLLGNLKLAIFLLLLIALSSSLGTVIEQEKPINFYEINYPSDNPIFGFVNSEIILSLGLNQIYKTSWFLLLLIVFGGSLLSCTASRQIPSFKLARLWQFFRRDKIKNKIGLRFNLNNTSLTQFSYLLRKTDYNVIQQGAYLYAYKGLVGKIGPILVHISIIIILLGSIIGSLTGFIAQEIIPKNELFHIQNIITSGPLSFIQQDFEAYINDFKITYTDQGTIDQFYSDIHILDPNLATISKKIIFVNEPLRFKGITFYQTDWNISMLSATINNKEKIEIPLQEVTVQNNARFWLGSLGKKNKVILILEDLSGKYSVYNSEKKFLGEAEIGKKIFLEGNSMRITNIIPATGVQIKSDIGIPIVYCGFLILIFSALFSYTSYFQIWAIKINENLYVCGETNRAIYFFEKHILESIDTLQQEVIKFKINTKNN